jgi:subtilisin family serine protease
MKVTVKGYLNVRVGKPSVNAPTYHYLIPGAELEVDGVLYDGDKVEGIDKWMKDGAGNYYWAGGINSDIVLSLSKKTSPAWFTQLNIESIWQKYGVKGEDITVAVLDTGVDINNKELSTTINGNNFWVAQNFDSPCNNINDLNGHGTRCASLIGARNLYDFNIGVAPKCNLLYCKISCDEEEPTLQSILDAIKWAIEKGSEIISISYFFCFDNDKEKQSFEESLNEIIAGKEVFLFACSGNNADSNNTLVKDYYPAAFNSFISVGATNGMKYSNITVENSNTIIHAPGIDIDSYGLKAIPDKASGTSFSTPIVAGIIALVIAKCKKLDRTWTVNQVKDSLFQTADLLDGFQDKKLINPTELFNKFFI